MPDGLGIAGLVTGIPGLVETCLQTSREIVELYNKYRATDELIETHFGVFLNAFHNITLGLELTEAHQNHIDEYTSSRLEWLLKQLRTILNNADDVLKNYILQSSASERLKYALLHGSILHELGTELEEWDTKYFKKLVLIDMRAKARGGSTQALEGDNALPVLEAQTGNRPGAFQPAAGVRRILDQSSATFQIDKQGHNIIEHYGRNDNRDPLSIVNDVSKLAERLNAAQPERMRILKCTGFRITNDSYELRFHIPEKFRDSTATTLRDLLSSPENRIAGNSKLKDLKHPLNDRITLANRLAAAIWFLHSGDFVHKAVCPENMLIFDHKSSSPAGGSCGFPYSIGPAFLAGFDSFRGSNSETLLRVDVDPIRSLYRHPERWGSHPSSFTMLHDIYSLGVVLLEVGMWTSFVTVDDETGARNIYGALRKSVTSALDKTQRASSVQEKLIDMAQNQLPTRMGISYTSAVLACLRCVETTTNTTSSVETKTKFMETVIEKLEGIKM